MSSETRIESVFQETGKRFGYEDVTVEITDFRDFKVQWKRSYGWIAFRVSDYIEGAPEPVIRDLAEALFGKIAGKDCGYGKEMASYVKDLEFVRRNRPEFLRRSENIDHKRIGIHKNLHESYERLIEQNLIEDLDDDIYLTWMDDKDRCEFTSTLLRVAAISTELDSKEVPDEVIDVILYEAICSIRAGLKNFGKCGEIESSWDDHPEMSAAMRWIQERNLNL